MEISWNFVSPEKWEPCNPIPDSQVPEEVLKKNPSVPVLFSTIGMCYDRIQGLNRNSRVWIVIVQISTSCWIIEWKKMFSLFRRSDWRKGHRNIWHSRRREQTAKTNSRSFYSWSSQEKQEPLPTSGKACFTMHFAILAWISKNCCSPVKQSHLRDIPTDTCKKKQHLLHSCTPPLLRSTCPMMYSTTPGVYTNEYPICICSLCVLENGGISECCRFS